MARGLFRCPYFCPLETGCTPCAQRHVLDIESEDSLVSGMRRHCADPRGSIFDIFGGTEQIQ